MLEVNFTEEHTKIKIKHTTILWVPYKDTLEIRGVYKITSSQKSLEA